MSGLPSLTWWQALGLNGLLLIGLWIADTTRRRPPTRVMRVTLDRAYGSVEEATPALRQVVTVEPLGVMIDEVDFVREVTRVLLHQEVTSGWWPRSPSMLSEFATREHVSLTELTDDAALWSRTDRTYLVPRCSLALVADHLSADFRLLSIDGRTATSYSTVYVDTARLDACRAHIQRRRRRWKLRTRLYVEDRLCRFEVKSKDGRGVTHKTAMEVPAERHGTVGRDTLDFARSTLAGHDVRLPETTLGPTVRVEYSRTTLAATGHGMRVTVDSGVHRRLEDRELRLDTDWVLLETKGSGSHGPVDRTLARIGLWPQPFSKYAVGGSVLTPGIADNHVRRLLGGPLLVT